MYYCYSTFFIVFDIVLVGIQNIYITMVITS